MASFRDRVRDVRLGTIKDVGKNPVLEETVKENVQGLDDFVRLFVSRMQERQNMTSDLIEKLAELNLEGPFSVQVFAFLHDQLKHDIAAESDLLAKLLFYGDCPESLKSE